MNPLLFFLRLTIHVSRLTIYVSLGRLLRHWLLGHGLLLHWLLWQLLRNSPALLSGRAFLDDGRVSIRYHGQYQGCQHKYNRRSCCEFGKESGCPPAAKNRLA